jgi:hypothetical protein
LEQVVSELTAIEPRQQFGIVQATGRMSVADVVQHAMVVQEVMHAVMKPQLHYGQIPGTDKPTLYKAGAEKLCMVFRIDDDYEIEDLSTADVIRYRVKCIGKHQITGMRLGSGVGECSGGEEKYKWRKAVCKDEFEATPLNMRRVKYARGKGGSTYTTEQIRTEPADLANTVLKMASKRAKIAMVLNVLAVSDMFGQDLEDLDAVLQEHLAGQEEGGSAHQPQQAQQAPAVWPDDAFEKRWPQWEQAVIDGRKTIDEIITYARTKGALTAQQEQRIRAIKAAPAQAAAEVVDSFIAEMDAAAAKGVGQ